MAIEFNGLRSDVVKGLIENKSLLAQSGSIYVGTGKTQLINNKNVPITEALVPGNSGTVCVKVHRRP